MSFTACYLYEAVAKYDWCKQVQTLCNLLCYMYKQTYFKEIFVNNQESQNTKQMESNWKFGESREVICPDGEMARTEPKRQNLPVQQGVLAHLLIRWNNIKDVSLFVKYIYRVGISVLHTVGSNI